MRDEPQRRRGQGPQRRRAHGDDRHPADAHRPRTSTREALSANPRYALLNEQIFAARGEDLAHRRSTGVERLATYADTIAPEAACTSVQLHLQVEPERVRRALERRAGDRRRPARARRELAVLLRQASCGARPGSRCSSRPPTPARRSSRPRACARGCGSASAGSPRSSTCSRRTSATSRRCCRCATTRTRSRCSTRGDVPRLAELRLHNGTIYRWNRPVYDVVAAARTCASRTACCRPARRSSTSLANAAFYYGLVRVLAEEERPLWSQMSFSAAEENFHAGARDGHRRERLLARARRGAGRRAGAAPAAAAGPRGARRAGASTPPTATGCSASSSGAA